LNPKRKGSGREKSRRRRVGWAGNSKPGALLRLKV